MKFSKPSLSVSEILFRLPRTSVHFNPFFQNTSPLLKYSVYDIIRINLEKNFSTATSHFIISKKYVSHFMTYNRSVITQYFNILFCVTNNVFFFVLCILSFSGTDRNLLSGFVPKIQINKRRRYKRR